MKKFGRNSPERGPRGKFYIALASTAAGAAALGLAFLPAAGVYFLITSVLLETAALSFLRAQKKQNPFPALKILAIIAYILLFLGLLLFIGGVAYSFTAAPQQV